MRINRTNISTQHENTIPLINVVFLMLVFFLIAGTIAPSNDSKISPVISYIDHQTPPEGAISMRVDGSLYYQGAAFEVTAPLPAQISKLDQLIVYPDQNLNAQLFARKIDQLRSKTNKKIAVLIERKSP